MTDATERFAAFPRSAQRSILEWIKQARTPDTRVGLTRKLRAVRARTFGPTNTDNHNAPSLRMPERERNLRRAKAVPD
ncbi:YdeI/OmpD-associated family protein [Ensifer sp. ENS09]|uniref:YdeI/OmpD-associated family protein n=1 Tax=Ensifer sp. ENS09 TaxID=2769263 RepID=UPI00177D6274|nr:YdeI/OmpD-associated family protein [Ensifer sp. ENS09]